MLRIRNSIDLRKLILKFIVKRMREKILNILNSIEIKWSLRIKFIDLK